MILPCPYGRGQYHQISRQKDVALLFRHNRAASLRSQANEKHLEATAIREVAGALGVHPHGGDIVGKHRSVQIDD